MNKIDGTEDYVCRLPGRDKLHTKMKFRIGQYLNAAADDRLSQDARRFYRTVARELEKVLRGIENE